MSQQLVYLNDDFLPADQAKISINDRGFRFGDGLFETIRVEKGAPLHWLQHMQRLEDGLKALKIQYDVGGLEDVCLELLAKNELQEGLARIAITRGEGGRGYLPDPKSSPTVLLETFPLPEKPQEPVQLWVSSYQKISKKALPVHVKMAQGLNSTLARMEAQEHGCFEAILLNEHGHICECSSSNIFWEKDGALYTPDESCGLLPGVMRQQVIDESELPVKTGEYTLEDIKQADRVFVTNVAWGIIECMVAFGKPVDR